MQYIKFALPLALASSAFANPLLRRGACEENSCLAAVTGKAALGDDGLRADHCKSYLATTVTPEAVTETTTIIGDEPETAWGMWKREQVTVCPNEVPNYASACETAAYSSACSCYGYFGDSTTTLARTTTTKTVYMSATGTCSGGVSTKTITVTVPSGTGKTIYGTGATRAASTVTTTLYGSSCPANFTSTVTKTSSVCPTTSGFTFTPGTSTSTVTVSGTKTTVTTTSSCPIFGGVTTSTVTLSGTSTVTVSGTSTVTTSVSASTCPTSTASTSTVTSATTSTVTVSGTTCPTSSATTSFITTGETTTVTSTTTQSGTTCPTTTATTSTVTDSTTVTTTESATCPTTSATTSTVTTTETTTSITIGASYSDPTCLVQDQVDYFVASFTDFLENTDTGAAAGYSGPFNSALAYEVFSSDFTDSSDSINYMAGYPLGGETFPSVDAFVQGQGSQYPVGVISMQTWIGCTHFSWRYQLITGAGANHYITGINVFEVTDDLTQIKSNVAEFNNGAWLENIGNPAFLCGAAAEVSSALAAASATTTSATSTTTDPAATTTSMTTTTADAATTTAATTTTGPPAEETD